MKPTLSNHARYIIFMSELTKHVKSILCEIMLSINTIFYFKTQSLMHTLNRAMTDNFADNFYVLSVSLFS